jgi:hypothetical protein
MSKIVFTIIGAVIATAVFFATGLLSFGSLKTETAPAKPESPCPWPDNLDAVSAAPKNHKVVLENEYVRVLDVTVLPGEHENLHAHCRRSVMYLMYEGIYKDYGPNGELIGEGTQPGSDADLPMTLWLEPQAPHAVKNLDSQAVRLIRVELKD